MQFDFFKLVDLVVMGQGGDQVGLFTIRGAYTEINPDTFNISWCKQYIGAHAVEYTGLLQTTSYGGFVVQGEHNYGGKFEICGGELEVAESTLINNENYIDDTVSEHWTIVLISAEEDKDTVMLLRSCLASEGSTTTAGLQRNAGNSRSLAVIRPSYDINATLKACAQADVVVPVMSPALEANEVCQRVLTWCDKSKKHIVPAKLCQDGYVQRGWLGALTAGMLWFDVSVPPFDDTNKAKSAEIMKPKAIALLKEASQMTLQANVSNNLTEDGSYATGWYYDPSDNKKHDMVFDFFQLRSGMVTGQGVDSVEHFVLSGTYEYNSSTKSGDLNFTKSYVGKYDHQVVYTGTITGGVITDFILVKGVHNYGGEFELKVSEKSGESHVMLSYQWNSQTLVRRIASQLKAQGLRIWFDIDGNMSGNINVAMAEGVEKARCILSFNTIAYAKSVNCKKELAYAAAINRPIVLVNLEPEALTYEPMRSDDVAFWIAKISREIKANPLALVVTSQQSEDAHNVLNQEKSMHDELDPFLERLQDEICKVAPVASTHSTHSASMQVHPAHEPMSRPTSSARSSLPPIAPNSSRRSSITDTKTLLKQKNSKHFAGGTVAGWYMDPSDGQQHNMVFEFFKIGEGRVVGQGEDEVSPFIIHGSCSTKNDTESVVKFDKQYIGVYNHVVTYTGRLNGSVIVGEHNYGGDFQIHDSSVLT